MDYADTQDTRLTSERDAIVGETATSDERSTG